MFRNTSGSAYMELALGCLNQEKMEETRKIEVNTYYRFYLIFKNMFHPEQKEFPFLRKSITNIILHLLAENDVRKGMTKEEYYKKLLVTDVRTGTFGETAKQVFTLLKSEEKGRLLSGWLRSYRSGSSLAIFTDMIHGLIDDSIVYHNNNASNEVLIYTELKESYELKQKLIFLISLFLDIQYHVEIYYEYHFGIIGIEDTMQIDEIAIY